MSSYKVKCHCQKVECEISLPVSTVVQCHCHNCRKMQGSDYSTWVAVPNAQFKVMKGESFLSRYEVSQRSSKSFCTQCGTTVFAINGKHFLDHKMVILGSIELCTSEHYVSELFPQMQVYTQDKAHWVSVHPEVPVFAGENENGK
ncbi:GFA family protein [Vibrio penaeicida]|uniref:GFA family protein n=1 Tax=Vibrio penaeicida TaxID=104609 RepID=UPI00163C32DF|nr:GFA family protein [Vibrio penaeicida]